MLALNVSIACEGRRLPSCAVDVEPATEVLQPRACHRVVSATGRWEGTQEPESRVLVFLVGCGELRVLASSEAQSVRLGYTVRGRYSSNDNDNYYKNNGLIRNVMLEPLANRYGLALAAS
eukprot:scaffold5711_cov64-Phaeocystis_antarctica.AAC.1